MSDELTRALHELASARETPPTVTGPEIRARATRRARRRTTVALSATAAAVALLAFGLIRATETPAPRDHSPAAPPAASAVPTPTLSPSVVTALPSAGTIDLKANTLTVGDRVMKVVTGFDQPLKLNGPLTIAQKPGAKTLTVSNGSDGTRYNAVLSAAVELLDADRRPVYLGATDSYGTDGIATHETADGWLTLGSTDAKWFYGAAEPGTVIAVEP
ncbi:hypothetical protein ABZX85_37825 [Streptomyces sp. NPDC004539]|uniref:hypothetical protein n=1 Tax=Streptomyces sp. NPDC004539 TaxID=3154280 RepID=UPI0033A439FF